jgi:hypothetical protein
MRAGASLAQTAPRRMMPMQATHMQATEIQDVARRLREAHGDRAAAEAAQKAVIYERAGDADEARIWRRIEAALLIMRGPSQS